MKKPTDRLNEWALSCNAKAEQQAQRLLDQHLCKNEDDQLVLVMALLQAAVATSQLAGMGNDNVRRLFDNALERVRAVNIAKAADA
jgi:hypothetical protein